MKNGRHRQRLQYVIRIGIRPAVHRVLRAKRYSTDGNGKRVGRGDERNCDGTMEKIYLAGKGSAQILRRGGGSAKSGVASMHGGLHFQFYFLFGRKWESEYGIMQGHE